MTRQRQIIVTVIYNDLGCIIDTKAEPYAEQNLQPTCNQLATDCISRQEAIDEAKHYIETGYDSDIIHTLENLPSANVRPVIRGKWVQHGLSFQFYCSNCEHEIMTNVYSDNPTASWKFCPNCGADMRGHDAD